MVNFQSIPNEEISTISVGVSLSKVILRLTKVVHEGSTHMPPSIHTKATLKTTSFFFAYSPREKKHPLNGNTIKEHPTTYQEFPFRIPT